MAILQLTSKIYQITYKKETESIEDSQPIDDGSDSDVSEDIGSASEYINSDSDIEADVQTPQLTVVTIEQPDMSHSPPVPARRSERNRMEPKWIRSWDFVTKLALSNSNTNSWQHKADCIANLMTKGVFTGMEQQVEKAILSVITGSEN